MGALPTVISLQQLVQLLCIPEVSSSNLCPKSGQPHCDMTRLPSVPPLRCHNSTLIRPRQLPSALSLIYYSLILTTKLHKLSKIYDYISAT